MCARLRSFLAISTSVSVVLFLILLAGCGGGTSNSSSSGSTSITGGSSGSSGSSGTGSGSSGSSGSGGSGSSSGGSGNSSFVAYAYTASSTAITGYAASSNGLLTPVPNSPLPASTDTYVVTNGANVYTANSAGSTLNIYSRNTSNGSLTLANSVNAIQGNPNPQDIVGSLALDHTGTTLYVGEFDSSGDDGFGVFNVSQDSQATLVSYFGNSEQFGPPLVFSPNNHYAYTANCYHLSWTIFGYMRGSDGALTSVNTGAQPPPSNDPNTMWCPEATAVSAGGYLAVAYEALGGQTAQYLVGTYHINSDGTLTYVAGSSVTTASSDAQRNHIPIAINFDPTGTYLAVAGNGGVQTYAINSAGLLLPAAAPQNMGPDFQNAGWDKANHLFASSSTELYVWNVSHGQLTLAGASPYPGGTGLAVLSLQ